MKNTVRKTLSEKIKNRRGETIAETLVSLLIIALAMVMLSGAIVSAAKINKKVKDEKTAFTTSDVSSLDGKVNIVYDSSEEEKVNVTIHITQDDNKYVYYK